MTRAQKIIDEVSRKEADENAAWAWWYEHGKREAEGDN